MRRRGRGWFAVVAVVGLSAALVLVPAGSSSLVGLLAAPAPAGTAVSAAAVGSALDVTTVAGDGEVGFRGDGGPAVSAALGRPRSLAFDGKGNLFLPDADNHRVRRVDASGMIATVAGTGPAAFGGDGGPATSAQLSFPRSIAFDRAGAMLVVDTHNHRVRKIDGPGTITTIAGDGVAGFGGDGGPATAAHLNVPSGVAVGPRGDIFIAASQPGRGRQ